METEIGILAGIEIELELNKDIIDLPHGGYHGDGRKKLGRNFMIERDSSLNREYFDNSQIREIISHPFPIENWEKIIDNFKAEIEKKTGRPNLELEEFINFNKSTGAHVHFSTFITGKGTTEVYSRDRTLKIKGKPSVIKEVFNEKFAKEFEGLLFERVKMLMGEKRFMVWQRQTVRHYAKRRAKFDRNQKYMQWNFRNEKTIEYRAWHLRGITTWEEFKNMWEIFFTTLKECMETELKKDKPFYSKRRFISKDVQKTTTIHTTTNVKYVKTRSFTARKRKIKSFSDLERRKY